jgi:peptide subunit release factor 1 (eRF1)
MLAFNDIQTLTSRPERAENSVLTIYLDVDQSRQANMNRGFENQLRDMLANVRKTIRDEREVSAFGNASQRISELVSSYNVGARGFVGVFDASDGFLWNQEVDFPVTNQLRWSRGALLQPLAAAFDEYERVGIVLLDRANLRLMTMFLGELEEHISEEFDRKKVRHTKTVGTDHLSSASRAQRRADEAVKLNLRHITKDIDVMLSNHGVERIILAGAPETTAELQAQLSKRLASRVIGRVDLPISATAEEIRNAVLPVAQKYEQELEETTVKDLVTSAAKAGRAVVGLGDTLNTVNHRRVWQLVYAEGFRSPGFECPKCDALFSIEPASCPFCQTAVRPVDDVVERAVDRVMRKGAKIEVVRSTEAASFLANAGGIGAFLRTRTSLRVA